MRNLIPAFWLATLAGVTSIPARASGEINFCVDIPTTPSATTYQPFQAVSAYAPAAIYSYAATVSGFNLNNGGNNIYSNNRLSGNTSGNGFPAGVSAGGNNAGAANF